LSIILKSTTTICRSENHRSPDEQGAGDGPLFMAHSAKRRQLVPPKNRGFIPAATGLANEAVGKAKQGIGDVVGSDKLKAEGAAQELKGDAQKATGDAKAAVKDATNKAAAAITKKL
jgi:uncharacterized protein YjbJ (UPF0337 family)